MTDLMSQPDTAIQRAGDNQITTMLQTMIEKGITSDNVAAMDKLADLYLKMEAENARKAFAVAKCSLQNELPAVAAMRVIPTNDGTVRSTFAAYEDIMKVIKPYLTRHGFSVSFTMECDDKRILAVCKLTHIGGHFEENKFAVRLTKPPGASDAQADGATRSYARRGALCDCLNIVVEKDNDARLEGDYISAAMATALRNRVVASGFDEKGFLALAGVKDYAEIREAKVSVLTNALSIKEQQKKRNSPAPPATHSATKTPHAPVESAAAGDIPPCPLSTEDAVDAVAKLLNIGMGDADTKIKEFLGGTWAACSDRPGMWRRMHAEFSKSK